MRFGKRAIADEMTFEEDGYYPSNVMWKRSTVDSSEPVIRDQRTPLGTMRFGKRSAGIIQIINFQKLYPPVSRAIRYYAFWKT